MVLRLRPAGRTGPASLPRTDLLHERPAKIVASQCAFGRTYGKFQIAILSLAERTFVAYATKIGRTRSKPFSFLARVGESEVLRPCLVPVSLSRCEAQDWPESRRSESAAGGAALARALLLADAIVWQLQDVMKWVRKTVELFAPEPRTRRQAGRSGQPGSRTAGTTIPHCRRAPPSHSTSRRLLRARLS